MEGRFRFLFHVVFEVASFSIFDKTYLKFLILYLTWTRLWSFLSFSKIICYTVIHSDRIYLNYLFLNFRYHKSFCSELIRFVDSLFIYNTRQNTLLSTHPSLADQTTIVDIFPMFPERHVSINLFSCTLQINQRIQKQN